MERGERPERFAAIEDRFASYTVYDINGDKIGRVEDILLNDNDEPEYIGVKTGLLGTRSTLIPLESTVIVESEERIEVQSDRDTVASGPSFDGDRDITPGSEDEVRSYYGLGVLGGSTTERSGHDEHHGGERHPGIAVGDTQSGEFREHGVHDEGVVESSDDLAGRDELRVQRAEEELRVGTREREAGTVNVRKRVRIDRESVVVPRRHEEVSVERVPVEGSVASEAGIGDDEVSIPVVEEEVVVEKRPVVKEELRIRKDSVTEEELVEEDVRKEEVEVEDLTERRRNV